MAIRVSVLVVDVAIYQHFISILQAKETIGEIEVTAVMTNAIIGKKVDGWELHSFEDIFEISWDCLLIAGNQETFMQYQALFEQNGMMADTIYPISVLLIPNFHFDDYIRLITSHVSIIPSNCWGGFTYHYLKMRFNSPIINMFFEKGGYLKMVSDLPAYLTEKPVFLREEWEPHLRRNYPVVLLNDVEIHFNHYVDYESALRAWNQRVKRINYDNLFFSFFSSDPEELEYFDSLTYHH